MCASTSYKQASGPLPVIPLGLTLIPPLFPLVPRSQERNQPIRGSFDLWNLEDPSCNRFFLFVATVAAISVLSKSFGIVFVGISTTLNLFAIAIVGKYMQMANKRTTSFYLTDEALEALDQVANRWGVSRNAVVEIAARLMRDNPSVFFRMIASNSIILPDDDEETVEE